MNALHHSALVTKAEPEIAWTTLMLAVETLRDATERVFTEAAEHLMRADERCSQVNAPLHALSVLGRPDHMARLRDLADQVQARVAEFVAGLHLALDQMAALSEQARKIGGDLSDIRRLVRTMTIVALNARVTVAGLGASRAALGVFTEDARLLVAEAAGLLAGLEQTSGRMMRAADQSRQRAAELAGALDGAIGPAIDDLSHGLLRFERDLADVTGKGSDVEKRSEHLRQATGSAVVALQIGDATRQRLDHILAILLVAASNPDAAEALQMLALDQLADTASDHATAISSLRPAMLLQKRSTDALLHESLEPFFQQTVQSRISGDLDRNLRRIETSLANTTVARSDLSRDSARMNAEFQELIEIVVRGSGVDDRMRLIGLNAVIACSKLGREGMALKEVSGQLRDLATETAHLMSALRTNLEKMGRVADTVIAQFENTSRLIALAPTDDLHVRVEEIATASAAATESVAAAQRGHLRDQAFDPSGLDRHSDELWQLAHCYRRGSCQPDAQAASALVVVGTLYTMPAERRVHAAFLAEFIPAISPFTAAAPELPPGNAIEDDIFF